MGRCSVLNNMFCWFQKYIIILGGNTSFDGRTFVYVVFITSPKHKDSGLTGRTNRYLIACYLLCSAHLNRLTEAVVCTDDQTELILISVLGHNLWSTVETVYSAELRD